jgi:hypothetical protein
VFQKIMNMMKPYPKLIFKMTKHQNGVILMLYFLYKIYIYIIIYKSRQLAVINCFSLPPFFLTAYQSGYVVSGYGAVITAPFVHL